MSLAGSLSKTNNNVGKNTSKMTNNGNKKPGKLGGMMGSVSGIQKNVAGTIVGGGNIIAKAAGALGFDGLANSLTGKTEIKYNDVNESSFVGSPGGGLKRFYSQFSGLSLNSTDRIDPYNTFECEFQFFPSITGVRNVTKIEKTKTASMITNDADVYKFSGESKSTEQSSSDIYSTTIGKLFQKINFSNSLAEAKNLKTTGGLMESGEKTTSRENDYQEYNDFTIVQHTKTETSFFQQPIESDLYVNLGLYIQKLTIPQIQVDGGDEVTTLVGRFPVPGNLVVPDNNNLQMEVVNVEAPVIENILYPWMRETTLPWWSYDNQPFTTANITIDFTEHSNVKYRFFGCRPTQIQLIQPDQAPNTNLTRNVQFTFDFMTVETIDAKTTEYKGLEEKKTEGKKTGGGWENIANGALFSAANTLKL